MTWVHSYVSDDKQKTFCIYNGPNPEATRRTATRNGLPLTEVKSARSVFLSVRHTSKSLFDGF